MSNAFQYAYMFSMKKDIFKSSVILNYHNFTQTIVQEITKYFSTLDEWFHCGHIIFMFLQKHIDMSQTNPLTISCNMNTSVSCFLFFFCYGVTTRVGQGFLIVEDSWSHSDTPQSVRLLWTSDQPDAETSTWQHATLAREKYPCPRWDSNSQSQQASGRRPKLDRTVPGIG